MNKNLSTVIILISLILFSVPVTASPIKFIDAVGIEKGTLSVSTIENAEIVKLNSSESFDAANNTAYILDYNSGGLIQTDQESAYGFEILRFLIAYFTVPAHFANLGLLAIGLLLVLIGLMGEL